MQIAHRVFLVVVAARITLQCGTAGRTHHDRMGCLVESRMQWRVAPHVDPIRDQPRLGFTPIGSGYRLAIGNELEHEAEFGEQQAHGRQVELGQARDGGVHE